MMHNDTQELIENQASLIISHLQRGLTRDEIIGLCEFEPEVFDVLEEKEHYRKAFTKAETEAFISDLETLKENFNNRNFNHQAVTLYFINRYGWSTKASRGKLPVSHPDSIIEAVCKGKVDAEVALMMLKAIELSYDISYKKEDRGKIHDALEKMEKFLKDNNP